MVLRKIDEKARIDINELEDVIEDWRDNSDSSYITVEYILDNLFLYEDKKG